MKTCVSSIAYQVSGLILVLILSGCVVRTYPLIKDRVDQDLATGNRGFLSGQLPAGEVRERKKSRTTQVVEIEFGSPIKFERLKENPAARESVPMPVQEKKIISGNRGYITESIIPEIAEVQPASLGSFEEYKVQKNDTLQKISQKFYGTTKKWQRIYEFNRDVLKAPDKLYPGQSLNIPVEGLKEPVKNLK